MRQHLAHLSGNMALFSIFGIRISSYQKYINPLRQSDGPINTLCLVFTYQHLVPQFIEKPIYPDN